MIVVKGGGQGTNLLLFYSRFEAPTVGCWNWTGALDRDGYGSNGGNRAHRVMYAIAIGDLVPGMHIDHLCFNRRCVNPAHLEQVTPRVNLERSNNASSLNRKKTHCRYGHAFDLRNTRWKQNGSRGCRVCERQSTRLRNDRLKLERQLRGRLKQVNPCPACEKLFNNVPNHLRQFHQVKATSTPKQGLEATS